MVQLHRGAIVSYRLTEEDASTINHNRETYLLNAAPDGLQIHIGNVVQAGESYPMIVVKVNDGYVNGQVFLDGNDVHWVDEVEAGDDPGTWAWE